MSSLEFVELYTFQNAAKNHPRTLKLHSDTLIRTLQEVSFPDKGGGFAYSSVSRDYGSHFIIWRSHGETLELSEFCDTEAAHSSLLVSFSGSAIVDCVVTEYLDYVEYLVCTSNGCARLTFVKPIPSSTASRSLFDEDPVFCQFYQLKGLQPASIKTASASLWATNGDVLFVYGLSSGVISTARVPFMATDPSEQYDLEQSSMIQKLWCGITPFTRSELDSPSSVVDLALFSSQQILVAVYKDHRLRLWDLKNRCCVVNLDLVDLLPKYITQNPADFRSRIAPGTFHRVKLFHTSKDDPTLLRVLVYLPVSFLGSTSTAESLEPSSPMNYWCWLEIDAAAAVLHERDCFRVLAVQAVMDSNNFTEENGEISILDFLPSSIDQNRLWYLEENDKARHDQMPPGVSENSLGVWWLRHQLHSAQNSVDHLYSLGWSSARLTNHVMTNPFVALPPDSEFGKSVPKWKCIPSCVTRELDSLSSNEGLLDEFLDSVFEPHRLSWFAIFNALKSLRSSHQLPVNDFIVPSATMYELRSAVVRTFTDQPFIAMSSCDFQTVLRTFYLTAMDYHDYGLQPLGFFELSYGTRLLAITDAKTCVPYAPSLVVVRRWGFSVVRPMDRYERMLWGCVNQSAQPPASFMMANTLSPDTDSMNPCVLPMLHQVRLLLENLHQHTSWDKWEAALFGSDPSVVDPEVLATNILSELNEHCFTLDSLSFTDPCDWRAAVFSDLRPDFEVIRGLEELTQLLEDPLQSCECLESLSSPNSSGHEETSPIVGGHRQAPSLSAILMCQAFLQTCETRLKLAFGLLLLSTRRHMSFVSRESITVDDEDSSYTGIIQRLLCLIESLRILHWIGSTWLRADLEQKNGALVLEQLNLLGFDQFWKDEPSTSNHSLTLSLGSTILLKLCSEWPQLLSVDPSTPWTLRCITVNRVLYTALNPNRDYGVGLQRVFRILLFCGQAVSLLKLSQLLNPRSSSLFLESLESPELGEPQSSLRKPWNGDYGFLSLCTGLAHLWQGHANMAKDEFIRASERLAYFGQTSKRTLASWATVEILTMDDLLLPRVFPGQFSLPHLFCLTEADGHEVCPEEVQVRFLMQVLPVLEATDNIPQVLDLCEYALNVLANIKPTSDGDESNGVSFQSRRLASILASLHSFQTQDVEGFLCNPVPTGEANGHQSNVYNHLIGLEAALWTRMFKHHLCLGNYTVAHRLIHCNPDIARRKDCLRQLIVTLCDRREAAQLVSLHYGSSEDEFLRILEARARATDVFPLTAPSLEDPQRDVINPYYDVLYAFHIRHANYRAAAMALFEHAHRLSEEAACSLPTLYNNGFKAGAARLLHGLQRQATYLVAAINALYLVPEEHQWLVRPGTGGCVTLALLEGADGQDRQRLLPQNKIALLVSDDWAFKDVLESEPDGTSETASLTVSKGPAKRIIDRSQRTAQTKQILQLKDLIRLYTWTRARLRIAQVCWEQGMIHAATSTPEDTVQCLLSLGIYDEAVRLSERFDLDITHIIKAVSVRCAELSRSSPVVVPSSTVNNQSWSSIPNRVPPLPGLANLASPLSQECDLVVQSLHNLVEVACGKQKESSGASQHSMPGNALSQARTLPLCGLYWLLLENLLSRLDPPKPSRKSYAHNPGHLHLLACECILSSGSAQLHLPEWLVAPLRSSSACTSHPAALLRLYIRYDRVEDAYRLAMDMLDAAQGTLADPKAFGLRTTLKGSKSHRLIDGQDQLGAQSLWLPHGLLTRLTEALRILGSDVPACSTMYDNLSKNMTRYLSRLGAMCPRLEA